MRRRSPTTTATPALAPPAVDGLALGRAQARRRSSRRRVSNQVVSTLLIAAVLGIVGLAGYAVFQAYGQDQNRQEPVTTNSPRTADEIIDHLESQPRWNGPGAPVFGVGDEPTAP